MEKEPTTPNPTTDKEAAIYAAVAFQVGTALTLTDGTLDIVAYK